jgi:hypothetical protein
VRYIHAPPLLYPSIRIIPKKWRSLFLVLPRAGQREKSPQFISAAVRLLFAT